MEKIVDLGNGQVTINLRENKSGRGPGAFIDITSGIVKSYGIPAFIKEDKVSIGDKKHQGENGQSYTDVHISDLDAKLKIEMAATELLKAMRDSK